MTRRILRITALVKKGAMFDFTPIMEGVTLALLLELAAPPVLVFSEWDAVIDRPQPSRLRCDASTDGLGATLKQERPDVSNHSIVCIIRAAPTNDLNCTVVFFLFYTDHEYLKQISR